MRPTLPRGQKGSSFLTRSMNSARLISPSPSASASPKHRASCACAGRGSDRVHQRTMAPRQHLPGRALVRRGALYYGATRCGAAAASACARARVRPRVRRVCMSVVGVQDLIVLEARSEVLGEAQQQLVRLDHVVAFGRRVAQLDDLDLRLTQRTTSPPTVSRRSAGVSHLQTLGRLLVAGASAPPDGPSLCTNMSYGAHLIAGAQAWRAVNALDQVHCLLRRHRVVDEERAHAGFADARSGGLRAAAGPAILRARSVRLLLLEDVAAEQVEREDLRDQPHVARWPGGGRK